MNKFTNVFDNDNNYIYLKKALVEWVLGTDGMNGATGEVLGQIPWTNEMEDLISWDKVDRKFDEAIGLRGDWNVYYLTSTSSVYDTYRDNFNLFINEKALAIVKVYENVINELNNMNKKCVVVEKFVGVDKNGFCKYKTIEKFYFDSYLEGINKVWEKYSKNSNWNYTQFVDAVYKGSVFISNVYGGVYCHLDDYLTNG